MSFVMKKYSECRAVMPVDDTQKKWICGYFGGVLC